MKLTEFRRAVVTEFGAGYGAVLTRDVALPGFGGRTPDEALAAGIPARDVWLALCAEQDVPLSRRAGAGLPDPGQA